MTAILSGVKHLKYWNCGGVVHPQTGLFRLEGLIWAVLGSRLAERLKTQWKLYFVEKIVTYLAGMPWPPETG
jgi:hypothetical protein